MICGIYAKTERLSLAPAHIYLMLGAGQRPSRVNVVTRAGSHALVGHTSIIPQPAYAGVARPTDGRPDDVTVAWTGTIYNRADLSRAVGYSHLLNDHDLVVALYRKFGPSFAAAINGRFAFALYDGSRRQVLLGRDHLGIETLYYHDGPDGYVFGSRIASVLAHPDVEKRLNMVALRRLLALNYNPGWDTLFEGIRHVRPGYLVMLDETGISHQQYWRPSFRIDAEKTEAEYCEGIREYTRDAIRARLPDIDDPLGIFLSGGMDSSSVAGITRQLTERPLYSFAYRCFGESFDESRYARFMASTCNIDHHEIVYSAGDVRQMESIVRLMDEPFSNIGIVIATYLLGQAAEGTISHVLSGDGGDELFGGHPVYTADKMAAMIEWIPPIALSPLTALLSRLPDSDRKLDVSVKLKRFSQSLKYPRELGTNRWRVYYDDRELGRLLATDAGASGDIFADLRALTHEADGPDALSRSLYVDYQSELGFSLRRMGLLRHFEITPHFPLLDYRLVEYAAAIPSNLKIQGLSDTKYIQRRAMEGVLPAQIVHRSDKLGHSIPFKNWLRNEPAVKDFVLDILSPERLDRRGLFNSTYVQALWDEHQRRRRNNSHRLWTLAVLELWLSANDL